MEKERPEKKKIKILFPEKTKTKCDFCDLRDCDCFVFFFFLAIRRNARMNASDRNSWVFPGSKKKNNYLHVYMYIYINQNTIFVSVAL